MEYLELEEQENLQISVLPLGKIAGFAVRPGLYDINGATLLQDGVNFTVHTHYGCSCELLLFKRGESEPYAVLPFPEAYKIGNVYSMTVFGLDIQEFEYAYHVGGPYEPEKGLLFNKENVLLDPYAKAVTGQSVWGERQQEKDYHGRVVKNNFDWGDMPQSSREMSDLVIYELHVRGFTRHKTSQVEKPGTFAGLQEKISYLKDLGINAVELMPVFEFDETMNMREMDGRKLLDYWGYNTVSFFSPNTSYTAALEFNREGGELKSLIRELHENGIEVILDVVFNHTAEGNEKGPVISFKGFDNNIYYMLTPDGNYYNFSGCGNTLNCNHPIVQQMIVECLRYWTVDYRVDGFRFDLASILGRNEDGTPMNNPPLLQRLAFDPVLGNVKLIAEAWDAGGLYQVGSFPAWKRWAEWNGRYRDTLREYLKGGAWASGEAAKRITGSRDLYGGSYAGYNSSVNFLTCHDGFTMYDLYAYNQKHNEANSWNNTDGSDDNRSWNCGEEGETGNQEVNSLRFKMIRNACAVLMCSRGTPMFLAGDEFANTQFGNNNPYCQDNEISWLDWGRLEQNRELYGFFKFMIGFRMEHPAIRRNLPGAVCGMPFIQIIDCARGNGDISDRTMTMGILYAGYDRDQNRDDVVYLVVNTFWEDVKITLPRVPCGMSWYLAVNTEVNGQGKCCYESGNRPRITGEFVISSRSATVFTGLHHQ